MQATATSRREPTERTFELWCPIEIVKGAEGGPMRVAGVISSETEDADGEVVLQSGLDFTYFLEKGWFNDNHEQGAAAGVGAPDKIEQVTLPNGTKATRVEGELFDTPEGRRIYELARTATGKRSLGFSIEGSIVKRNGPGGKIVAQARVRDCAVTRHPKNPDATLQALAKALAADEAPPPVHRPKLHAVAPLDVAAFCKSVTAGYNAPADTAGGNALVPQNLQGGPMAVADRTPDVDEKTAIERIARKLKVPIEVAKRLYARMLRAKGKGD